MKSTSLFLTALFLTMTLTGEKLSGQSPDFSLAKVGKRIFGVYVFFGCEPANPYTYVKTIEVKIDWTGSYTDSFERVIEKAKKKEPNFNGLIFQSEDLSKADLIRFADLESTKGGLSYGSKVSFVDKGQECVGEVVELESSKGEASIKFKNVFFEDEIGKFDYKKLTPITNEKFQEKLSELEKLSENYKFQVGDKVSWISGNVLGQNKKQFSGEIISLDKKSHKASIKYFSQDNKENISNVSFLDLIKVK